MDKAEKCGFHLTCLFNCSPNKICDSTCKCIKYLYLLFKLW